MTVEYTHWACAWEKGRLDGWLEGWMGGLDH